MAASSTFFAVTDSPYFLRADGLSPAAIFRLASLAIPVAEQICSTHPTPPQLQCSHSSSRTWIWPISPPSPCLPAMIFSLRITPPPTPVPRVTITRSLYPLPPPCHISPRAATLASLPLLTGIPSNRRLSSSWGFRLCHPRLTQTSTYPPGSTGPGTPKPTPARSFLRSMPFAAIFSLMESATSGRIWLPPSSLRVFTSHFSSSSPVTSNSPIFTDVPPTSTPIHFIPMVYTSFPLIFILLLQLDFHHHLRSHHKKCPREPACRHLVDRKIKCPVIFLCSCHIKYLTGTIIIQ